MFRARAAMFAAVLIAAAGLAAPVEAQSPPPAAPAAPPAGAPPQAQPLPPPVTVPAPPPVAAQPAPEKDAFGEEVALTAKTVVRMKGSANWDTAFETLVDNFKTIYAFIERSGLKAAGPAMTIYTSTDDSGFKYEAAVPIEAVPANPPKGDIEIGQSPAGKMLKFVHRGSYDAMDTTYEAITNYLDSKSLEAQENFVEEYVTDPVKTPDDKLVVNVYVPVKSGT